MTRRPRNVAWVGFTPEQTRLLDFLDHLGNNGWARNGQADEVMPTLLDDCEAVELTLDETIPNGSDRGASRGQFDARPVGFRPSCHDPPHAARPRQKPRTEPAIWSWNPAHIATAKGGV